MNTSLNGHILPVVNTKLDMDFELYSDKPINTSEDAVRLVGSSLVDMAREVSCVICTDGTNRPICVSVLGIGNTYMTSMPVQQIMQVAILSNAQRILLIHNHPILGKNAYKPSPGDVYITDVVLKACDLMDIMLMDSIVISSEMGRDGRTPLFYSMQKHRDFKFPKAPGTVMTSKYFAKTEQEIPFGDKKSSSDFWKMDVTRKSKTVVATAYSPKELEEIANAVKQKKLDSIKERTLTVPDFLLRPENRKSSEPAAMQDSFEKMEEKETE